VRDTWGAYPAPVKTPVKILVTLVVLAALGGGGFLGFMAFERHEAKGTSGRACGSLDTASGSPVLPAELALPDGQKLLSVSSQGKTVVVMASTPGGLSDLNKVRDQVLDALTTQGFTRGSTEGEAKIEAEGQFSGKATGTIRVRPLCTDRLELRYKLSL
jgi:hypothetical protein